MKKLIAISMMLIVSISSFAQKRFEPQLKISYDAGVDHDKNQSFGAEILAGYAIQSQFRIGVGTGIYWCKHLYEDAHINTLIKRYEKEYRETAAYVPLFVNGKYSFIEKGISPYVSMDIGYTFFIPFSDYAKDNKLGFMMKPSVGVDFPCGKIKVFLEVGYKWQSRKFERWEDTNGNYSQLSISTGLAF